jgi:cell division protein FtsI (penicillin-binding protein 3)
MVKPKFVKEVKEWNKVIKEYPTQIINPSICNQTTVKKVQAILQNVVKKGTGSKLYSKNFSMAGKTGTAQVNYNRGDEKMYYASSFVGYFPADKPEYSCIVVVHKPNVANGYFGADVAGPVFKRIAQKIFTDVPSTNVVKNLAKKNKSQEENYYKYNKKLNSNPKVIPNLKGMPGMDAVALLENLGMKVKAIGIGKVRKQSIQAGEPILKNNTITLELS